MHTFGPAFDSLDDAFKWVLQQLLKNGKPCDPRGLNTLELFPMAFSLRNPRKRFVSVPERRWSIVYAIAEFCWHARGSTSVEEIAHYAPRWRRMPNTCGEIVGSSYGARIFNHEATGDSQWEKVLQELRSDSSSRRCILYFPNFTHSMNVDHGDVACAVSLQFVLRDGKVDALATMRSNDAMLGMPYDVFFFSMLQEMVATELGAELGTYHHVAGSLHLYESDVPLASRIVASRSAEVNPMTRMTDTAGLQTLLDGEAACRLVGPSRELTPTLPGYWTQLLSVIREWHMARLAAEKPPLSGCISDPVLCRLYSLRY